MSTPRPWIAENARERERLRALVGRLRDDDLRWPLDDGWTIAAVLAHVAFWDQRALVLLDRWDRDGELPASSWPASDADVDWINDAAKALCLALAPRTAAELALRTAEAVDRRIEALSDDRVRANTAAGHPINLRRAEHREEHIDQIEQNLGRGGASS
jgi:DinB family protein